MTTLTNYSTANKNCYGIQDSRDAKETNIQYKIESLACTAIGMMGVAYQLCLLLFG